MDREEYDHRVQEAFDRRVDPVDDPAVRDYALEHPEVLEELAEMRSAIGLLGRNMSGVNRPARRPGVWRRRTIGVAAAIFVLCAASAVLVLVRGSGSSEPRRLSQASRILWHRMTVTTETGSTRRVSVTGSNGWSASESVEIAAPTGSGAIAMLGTTHMRTGIQGRESR
jgi:hypothetical protein